MIETFQLYYKKDYSQYLIYSYYINSLIIKISLFKNSPTIMQPHPDPIQIITSTQTRQQLLQKQRQLQLKNTGIPVTFHIAHYPYQSYLLFNPIHYNTIQQWLIGRIPINIYNCVNYQQEYVVDKEYQLYLIGDCFLCFRVRYVDERLKNGQNYIIGKNNATIHVLTQALGKSHQINNDILEFINNPACLQIQPNPKFQLNQQWMFAGLNQSQKKAIKLVTKQKISFIKGPPGCGKTKTIARLATIFTYFGHKMLIGAVSNNANRTILSTLLKQCEQMNYHPNIVLYINKQPLSENILHPPEIRALTFRYKLVKKYMELDKTPQKQKMTEDIVQHYLDAYWKNKDTFQTFISVCYQAMGQIFAQADIIIITTVSTAKMDIKLHQKQRFQPFIGILDQASQASWADAYCFLGRGVQKMVFIGDDKQLPPTVISQQQILKQTMFSTLFLKNLKYYCLLNTQFRMHPTISQFPNYYFYQKQLNDGVTAQERASDLKYFQRFPVSFINCNSLENQQVQIISGKKNYANYGQIQIIKKLIKMFPKQQYKNIGIISPYDLQIKSIIKQLSPNIFQQGLTAKTCDGYQGSQKQYIFVSCVRSNQQGKIGFCSDQNRLNVTITRARRGLVLIGNFKTFLGQGQSQEKSKVWKDYLGYLSYKNCVIQENYFNQFIEHLQNEKNQQKLEHEPISISMQNKIMKQIVQQKALKINPNLKIQHDEQDEQQIVKSLGKQHKELIKQLKTKIQKARSKNKQIQQIVKKQLHDDVKQQQISKITQQIQQLNEQIQQIIVQIHRNMASPDRLTLKITKQCKQYYQKIKKQSLNIAQLRQRVEKQAKNLHEKVKQQGMKQYNHVRLSQLMIQVMNFGAYQVMVLMEN